LPLNQKEIRDRAVEFVFTWSHDLLREKADAQTFWNEFFYIFGISRRRLAAFEAPVRKLGDKAGSIDLFWKGMLIVEHKSPGQNFDRAEFDDSSLSDLYDPDSMPQKLLEAHRALDTEVDLCYRPSPFKTELERLKFLFDLYIKCTDPIIHATVRPRKGISKIRGMRTLC